MEHRPPPEGPLKVEKRGFGCLGVYVFRVFGFEGFRGLGFRV